MHEKRPAGIELGSRLRNMRTERGLSGVAVAEALDTLSSVISRVECGARLPSVELLWGWLDFLAVDKIEDRHEFVRLLVEGLRESGSSRYSHHPKKLQNN